MIPVQKIGSDDRGAVMVTGLFMSCFLIGSLWFIMGIGDTLVFRDRMQEAADHAAFSNSALQAKGMNFVSLCNLILLAAVVIHLILGIIHDILLAICIVSYGTTCSAWVSFRDIYTGYFDILKPAAKAIHVAEVAASYGYPAMGFVQGVEVGSKYGGDRYSGDVMVLPINLSLVPGSLLRLKKEGLPVEARPMNYLCDKAARVGFNTIFGMALDISPMSATGTVLKMVKGWIGGALKFRYCNSLGSANGRGGQIDFGKQIDKGNESIDEGNEDRGDDDQVKKVQKGSGGSSGGVDPGFDSFWGEDGPLVVFGPAGNGSDWFTTWATNISPKPKDTSESRVSIATYKHMGIETTPKTIGYIAQSEFYFDCDKTWYDVGCNDEDNATFQIKWRARLTRVREPDVINDLAGVGLSWITNSKYLEQLKGDLAKKLGKSLGLGALGRTQLKAIIDEATGLIKIGPGSVLGDLGKSTELKDQGVYH